MSDYKDEFYDEISAAYDERKTEFTDIRTNTHEKFEISKIQFVSSEDILNSQAMGEYFSSVTTDRITFLAFVGNPDTSISFFSKCILRKSMLGV